MKRLIPAALLVLALTGCADINPNNPNGDTSNSAATPNVSATRDAQFARLSAANADEAPAATTVPTVTPDLPSEPASTPTPQTQPQTLNVFVTPIEAEAVTPGE